MTGHRRATQSLIVCWSSDRQRYDAHLSAVRLAIVPSLGNEECQELFAEISDLESIVKMGYLSLKDATDWLVELHQRVIAVIKDKRRHAWEAELEVLWQQTTFYESLYERTAVLIMQADLFGRPDQLKLAGIGQTLTVGFSVGSAGYLNKLVEADLESLPRYTWEEIEGMLIRLEGKLSLLSLSQKAEARRFRKQAEARDRLLQSNGPVDIPHPTGQRADLGNLGVELLSAQRRTRRGHL